MLCCLSCFAFHALPFMRTEPNFTLNNPDLCFLLSVPLMPHPSYLERRCGGIAAQGPYVLVWVHTTATYWLNCPSGGMLGLWRIYERYRFEALLSH